MSNFAARSPEIAALLKDVTFRKPAQVFEREMVLDLGGVRVRIMWLGPGHTRGDTVMFVEEDRVLFAGDLTMKGLFPAFASPQSPKHLAEKILTSKAALEGERKQRSGDTAKAAEHRAAAQRVFAELSMTFWSQRE